MLSERVTADVRMRPILCRFSVSSFVRVCRYIVPVLVVNGTVLVALLVYFLAKRRG